MKNKECFSCVILAAGKSTRMGRAKLFLPWNEKQSFFDKIYSEYLALGCQDIICVTNKENYGKILNKKVTLVLNSHLDWERFYSLKIGLQSIKNNHCFIQPIDNPFIDNETLTTIFANKNIADYIVPTFKKKGGHPILINKKLINYIANYPQNDAHMRKVLQQFSRKNIAMNNDIVLKNIDTPEQYNLFRKI